MMAKIEINNAIWSKFSAISKKNQLAPNDYLEYWLRWIIKHAEAAGGSYHPVANAIVIRGDTEILVVGNDYGRNSLHWNLPGGASDPGEDLHKTVVRELFEETGIKASHLGDLAWITQVYYGPESTGLIAFVFEVNVWEGEITLDVDEMGGRVRRAEFVSFEEACYRIIPGNAIALRDWLAAPHERPRLYWKNSDEDQKILSTDL
jgi:8-oxo-dGTP pyrophosphatase MutT (NUDIX family)